jgi:glycosyltransferase involved in cell wall biosynthesis
MMSVVIFGDVFTFPEGNAATNRVYTYAKGFIENGIDVHVICFDSEYTEAMDGIVDGIYYYHPFAQNKRSKYMIARRWLKVLKYFKTITLIKKLNKESRIIALKVWTNSFETSLFAWHLAKLSNTKLFCESNEHPLRFYQGNMLRQYQGKLKTYLEAHLFDGIFCISRYLCDFYKNIGIDPSKLFLVPSTVDPTRFNKPKLKPFSFRYIGYFGSLTFDRDNVDILINAFAKVKTAHPEIHLVLGGFCTSNMHKKIESMVNSLNIGSNTHLLNYLTRNEIEEYVLNADVLVMVRADDMRSQASYPSKLTEFLATSNPVVTVNVGEISDYINDGINAFIVPPGDSEALAEKLIYVLNNQEIAKQVGIKGKELTENIFNYNYQTKRMIGFINSINSKHFKKIQVIGQLLIIFQSFEYLLSSAYI